jgi:MoaA/NifB/PqqE/SkfB family radical SAM enzyme
VLRQLQSELHYQHRCLRLGYAFLAKRFIHCNLQVTYRCNFQCAICDFWKTTHRPEEELTLEQVRLIGSKLNQLGSLIVSLAGGEPLIRQDLYDIIRILNQANHFPILITNGWYVNESVAMDIHRAGLQEISVSLDYRDPARHDAQRGCPGSWERAVRALELLNHHRPSRRNRVHMITVLMDDNLEEIEGLIQLARDLGVTYMVNLYSWNRGSKPRRTPEQRVTAHLLELKKKYPAFITLTSYLENLDAAIAQGGVGDCQAGRLLMNIDPRGNVSRCTETLDEPVGNLLTESMMEIAARLRSRQRERECSQCWTSCRGFAESMFMVPRLRQLKEFYISVKPHG